MQRVAYRHRRSRAHLPEIWVCAVLGFPVPSYYYAKKRAAEPAARDTRDAMLKEKIMQVWKGE